MVWKLKTVGLLAVLVLAAVPVSGAQETGWTGKFTVTSVSDVDFQGDVVMLTVNQAIDNSAGCTGSGSYALRDESRIKGYLALLTTAFVAGVSVEVFVTGVCDPAGVPSINSVTMTN